MAQILTDNWHLYPLIQTLGFRPPKIRLQATNIFTSDWPWIKVCQIAVFGKIDITMTTIRDWSKRIGEVGLRHKNDWLTPKARLEIAWPTP